MLPDSIQRKIIDTETISISSNVIADSNETLADGEKDVYNNNASRFEAVELQQIILNWKKNQMNETHDERLWNPKYCKFWLVCMRNDSNSMFFVCI